MDSGGSKTLAAAKLKAVHQMHQPVVDFVPDLTAGRRAVCDGIDAAFVSAPEPR
jgi:hypothetical protein